jgi:hypothetical protein
MLLGYQKLEKLFYKSLSEIQLKDIFKYRLSSSSLWKALHYFLDIGRSPDIPFIDLTNPTKTNFFSLGLRNCCCCKDGTDTIKAKFSENMSALQQDLFLKSK